jgi:hypothetical protein
MKPHIIHVLNLQSLHPSSVQLFSSALTVYVPPVMPETKFYTHTEQQAPLVLYTMFYFRNKKLNAIVDSSN